MSGFRVDIGGGCVDVVGAAGGVSVGRVVAGGGQGVAGRLGRAGSGAGRSGVDDGVVGALAPGGRGDWAVGAVRWAPDDRDGDLCAVDGSEGSVSVGVSGAGRGGVGLDSSAPVLPDLAMRAGARRVDGPQAHAADRLRDGERVDAHADRDGGAGEAVCAAGGQDRFDGDRGRREVPDRRGSRRARGQGARARGPQAGRASQGVQAAGAGSVAVDGPASCGR